MITCLLFSGDGGKSLSHLTSHLTSAESSYFLIGDIYSVLILADSFFVGRANETFFHMNNNLIK